MSELKHRVTEDMKNAMRARETARLSAIRLLLAALKQREVDERKELTDADVVAWEPIWDLQEQFEPLLMFIALPYKTDHPRFSERASLVERFKRLLREEGLHEIQPIAQRHLLRQLFLEARQLSSL